MRPKILQIFFLLSISYYGFSQSSVTGEVKNENAKPLGGATLVLQNAAGTFKKNVQSAPDGTFTFTGVQPGQLYKLSISYVGYTTQEKDSIVVNENSPLHLAINLLPSFSVGESVVVVAYSTQKKANLTGAVDQISGQVLENRSLPNVTQGLQGMIPNLNIVMGDGKPIQSPAFNIRGNTSIGQGGNALVLIDGVEGNPSLMNPNDIASITVLKDAASAAVYGARAAFGVVLITTKNPTKGKTNITYSSNFSVKSPVVRPDYVTNGYQFAKIFNDAWSAWNDYSQFPQNVNKTVKFSQAYLEEYEKRNNDPSLPKIDINPVTGEYVYYGNTDWYDLLYKKNTFASDHNLSVSGSNEKAGYWISARYYGQNGLFRYNGDDYETYNFRAKGYVQVLPWLKVENNTDYSNLLYHNPLNVGEGGSIWRNIADEGHEMSPLFNPDGNLSYSAAYTVGDLVFGKNGIDFDQRTFRNRTAFTAELFSNKLRLKGDFTIQDFDDNATTKRVPIPYSVKPNVVQYIGTTTNDIAERYAETQYMASNIYAEYENKFGKHSVKALAGYNYEVSTFKGLNAQRNGLIFEDAESINLALGTAITTGGPYERWVINGSFFRVNYSFDDRYLLEVNGRYDGTSKFPSNSQFGTFPSVSAGWRVSNEKFWNVSPAIISDLKIRGSYGSLGNGSIGSYQFMELFGISQSSRVLGGIRPQSTSQPNVVPDNLIWEKATTLDIGIDAGFLNNRLYINADWYMRNTTDMFTQGPTLPAVFGISVPKGNYADLRTTGWELIASWRDNGKLLSKPFSYGIRLSVADYQSEIRKYYNPEKRLNDYYVGQKLGEIWGYVTDGFFTADNISQAGMQAQFIKASNGGNTMIGDVKFTDLDKDGAIDAGSNTVNDPGDRRIIGNSQPRYTFGALFDFDWNNFFISAFFQGVGKQDWWPGAEADAFWGPYNRPYNRVPTEMVDEIWSEQNPNTYFPRLRGYVAQGTGRELNVPQTKYLQNVAYVRLKNIQVGYSFPLQWISRLKMSQARIYISADNIWTYSPMYKVTHNLDVENIQGSDRVLTNGTNGNGNNYPIMKGWTVGLNVHLYNCRNIVAGRL
jgi:TonB-linked SusC/RagA family outer membrane protein